MGLFPKTALDGVISTKSASFFRLDETGTNAISPILDVVPSATDERVVLDVVQTETHTLDFLVTDSVLQDFSNIQSNIQSLPERLVIQGLVVNSLEPSLVSAVGLSALPGFDGETKRTDILKIKNLQELARAKEPIMVVTPRLSLPKALIESIIVDWTPEDGESLAVSISVKEVRIISPTGKTASLLDLAGSYTGNNAKVNVGSQGSGTTNSTVSSSSTPGLAPVVGG